MYLSELPQTVEGFTNAVVRCTFTDNQANLGPMITGTTCLPYFYDCRFVVTRKIAGSSVTEPLMLEYGVSFFARNCLLKVHDTALSNDGDSGLLRVWETSNMKKIDFESCTIDSRRLFVPNAASITFADADVSVKNSVFRQVVNRGAPKSVALTNCASIDAETRGGTDCVALANEATFKRCFKDCDKGDYTPCRPLVDAGLDVDWMNGVTDLSGECRRIVGRHVDIGAFEYDPAGAVILFR